MRESEGVVVAEIFFSPIDSFKISLRLMRDLLRLACMQMCVAGGLWKKERKKKKKKTWIGGLVVD